MLVKGQTQKGQFGVGVVGRGDVDDVYVGRSSQLGGSVVDTKRRCLIAALSLCRNFVCLCRIRHRISRRWIAVFHRCLVCIMFRDTLLHFLQPVTKFFRMFPAAAGDACDLGIFCGEERLGKGMGDSASTDNSPAKGAIINNI